MPDGNYQTNITRMYVREAFFDAVYMGPTVSLSDGAR